MEKTGKILKYMFVLISLATFSGCRLVGALVMSREEKTTVAIWKDDNYKVRIQKRRGWAGPHYYHCKVKERKLGGLYYQTVVRETFSREKYSTCIINYPIRLDTLSIDICNKRTTKLPVALKQTKM